ncbi:hypothetical protein LENED_005348 [Lentinula edodes]|uniref:Uncharacterized protein n=1 Tax=Lentinula edodes TaxID=5353 RepID=A0A1Q3E8W6_LENED|nr:hypothetical protein LENED_005348 [Lentinula edodes]
MLSRASAMIAQKVEAWYPMRKLGACPTLFSPRDIRWSNLESHPSRLLLTYFSVKQYSTSSLKLFTLRVIT